MPAASPSSRRRLGLSSLLTGLGLAVLVGWVALRFQDRGEAQYQGKSVRSWFRQVYRAETFSFGPSGSAKGYEARIAFLEMGTNAVPFLVREAFTFRPDTFLRTNLYELFREVPEWAGRGAFTPNSEINQHSTRLLRAMRPPADVLLPLLRPHLDGTNRFEVPQALILLGMVGPGAESVVPQLLQVATNTAMPANQGFAWQSILQLGARASNALPAVLDKLHSLPGSASRSGWLSWISELGQAALPAVPLLEHWLSLTNIQERDGIQTALTLVHLDPNHREAWRVLNQAADLSSNKRTLDGPRETLCDVVVRGGRQPNPRLAALIEPLARFEVAAWNPRGASFRAVQALERAAPDRAKILYESLLNQPQSASIHAATSMLRVDRNHEEATRALIAAIPAGPNANGMPIWALGDASSSNRIAMAALEDVLAGRKGPTDYNTFQAPTETAKKRAIERARQEAEVALARIRYREARAAHGLPEGDWW